MGVISSLKKEVNETAHIVVQAIGKLYLEWVIMPEKQRLNGLTSFGVLR